MYIQFKIVKLSHFLAKANQKHKSLCYGLLKNNYMLIENMYTYVSIVMFHYRMTNLLIVQVRHEQLMRQQEKMIQDMERAVYRREAITLK